MNLDKRKAALEKLADRYEINPGDPNTGAEDLGAYLDDPATIHRWVAVTRSGEQDIHYLKADFDEEGAAREYAVGFIEDPLFAELPVLVFDLDRGRGVCCGVDVAWTDEVMFLDGAKAALVAVEKADATPEKGARVDETDAVAYVGDAMRGRLEDLRLLQRLGNGEARTFSVRAWVTRSKDSASNSKAESRWRIRRAFCSTSTRCVWKQRRPLKSSSAPAGPTTAYWSNAKPAGIVAGMTATTPPARSAASSTATRGMGRPNASSAGVTTTWPSTSPVASSRSWSNDRAQLQRRRDDRRRSLQPAGGAGGGGQAAGGDRLRVPDRERLRRRRRGDHRCLSRAATPCARLGSPAGFASQIVAPASLAASP